MRNAVLRYLYRNGRTWWFKRNIPLVARPAFEGRTAYLENLMTDDLRIAAERRDVVLAKTDVLFESARQLHEPG